MESREKSQNWWYSFQSCWNSQGNGTFSTMPIIVFMHFGVLYVSMSRMFCKRDDGECSSRLLSQTKRNPEEQEKVGKLHTKRKYLKKNKRVRLRRYCTNRWDTRTFTSCCIEWLLWWNSRIKKIYALLILFQINS